MYTFKLFHFNPIKTLSTTKPCKRKGSNLISKGNYVYLYCGKRTRELIIRQPKMNQATFYLMEYIQEQLFDSKQYWALWEFNMTTNKWNYYANEIHPYFDEIANGVTLNRSDLVVSTLSGCNKNNIYIYDLLDPNKSTMRLQHEWPQNLKCLNLFYYYSNDHYYTVAQTYCEMNVYKLDSTTRNCSKISRGSLYKFGTIKENSEFIVAFYQKIYILVIDSFDELLKEPIKKTIAFNLETAQWENVYTIGDDDGISYPEHRNRFHVCQYTDTESNEVNVILSGGISDGKRFDDVWRLNLRTLQWTCLTRFGPILPYPICDHASTVTDQGKLYVYGGTVEDDNGDEIETDDFYSAWLKIPSLTEICWEAVTHFFGDLTKKTGEELLDLGIAPCLVASRLK